jgi:uncharacterized protein (TIGR02996 family)
MSTDDEAFLNAIAVDPADEAPWLIYADWLDDRDDEGGAYLRVLAELVSASLTIKRVAELREKLVTMTWLDPVWRERVRQLRVQMPFRCIVDEVTRLESIMLDGVQSLLCVYVLAGQICLGERINIPLQNGQTLNEKVISLESFQNIHQEIAFVDAVPDYFLGFHGPHVADLGVQIAGFVTPHGERS